jgi:probable DNA metabolism protein
VQLIVYDGSFEGFLSAVFDVYEYRYDHVEFSKEENYQSILFGAAHIVATDETKTKRVWLGLKQKLSATALMNVYKTFLSEKQGIEVILLYYIRYVFASKTNIEDDMSHEAVLTVIQTAKIVHREKHRMEAFIRFQLTQDDLYYAVIEPDFDVLPLIKKHFHDRYADQAWLIYDTRRKYGLYYDKQKVEIITMSFEADNDSGKNIRSIFNEKEELYQKLWQQYFTSINIIARKNMKLHIQHMPRRYWKFLTEKFIHP